MYRRNPVVDAFGCHVVVPQLAEGLPQGRVAGLLQSALQFGIVDGIRSELLLDIAEQALVVIASQGQEVLDIPRAGAETHPAEDQGSQRGLAVGTH